MSKAVGGVIINEVETEPLSEYVINFITTSTKESPYLDFKKVIDIGKNSAFPELAKDIFAFSNYGGGWLLLGWDEHKKNQFCPVGLPEDFELEPANLQTKFNSYSNEPLAIDYKEFTKDFRNYFPKAKDEFKNKINSISDRFAAIFIPPSSKLLVPKKEGKYSIGTKEKVVFKVDTVFYRRGTQSIPPSDSEKELINRRLQKEDYRCSLLSGEPDDIRETIYSNLFEITNLPKFVYSADKKEYDIVSIKVLLKQEHVFPEFYFKFKMWKGKIITFEDLFNESNPYRKLVRPETISKQPIEGWLSDTDKHRIIVDILNREIRHHAMKKGMWLDENKYKLYYPSEEAKRTARWQSRYSASTKTVAAKFYAQQIKRFLYWHVSCNADVYSFGNKFYMRILPGFIITEDGKHTLSDATIGTIITRLSYNRYNSQYLNNVLFWIHQLGENKDITIQDYLTISKKPIQLECSKGIIYDIPSSEFSLEIEEDDEPEIEEDYEL